MKKTLLILFLAFLPISVLATSPTISKELQVFWGVPENYESVIYVDSVDIDVPTVVEVKLDNIDTQNQYFLVSDKDDQVLIPSLLVKNYVENEKTFSVTNNQSVLRSINDGEYDTSETFMLSEDGDNSVSLEFNYNQPIRTDGFNFSLDKHVALPDSITISYLDENGDQSLIVSVTEPTKSKIDFPEVTSTKFVVDMEYSQPLRVTEASFDDLDLIYNKTPGLRFLAKPNNSYAIFFDREYYVDVDLQEAPNLYNDEDVLEIQYSSLSENNLFVESDIDGDGVVDKIDNCVRIANPDQVDINDNGRGDVCDDYDRDGVINSKDNCPNDPNRRQLDKDGDGIGYVCDDEESRVTEKYPFIVWGGIIMAILVFIFLYLSAVRSIKEQKEKESSDADKDNKVDKNI